MLCEFNVVLSWAPTYFHEALGVPLSQLGIFAALPVITGIACKAAIAKWESSLLAKGRPQLLLRKVATVYGTAITSICLVVFYGTRSRYLASLAYCGIVLGNSFDYSGFLPNFIEAAGDDPSGHFYAWLNTVGWGLSFLAERAINFLATVGRGDAQRRWAVVWLVPVSSQAILPLLVVAGAGSGRLRVVAGCGESCDDGGVLAVGIHSYESPQNMSFVDHNQGKLRYI